MSNDMTSACPDTAAQDPKVVSNPPGLAEISYRVDDFTGFRRALLTPRPGEQAIGAWRPAPGDLGLQVLEWWAYVADVLTFYNERSANESYLRTATQPGSVANLVALLGYQPAPGIAATGTVAALRSAARPAEPVVIPAGLRLSSVATPGVASQTFEAGQAASFTGPSSVPVTLPPDNTLRNDGGTPQSVLLAGRVSGVKTGDQLLLVEQGFTGADDNWSLVTVGSLTPTPDPATGVTNTLVMFSAGVWGPSPGVPGPGSSAQSTDYRLMRPTAAAALWNQGPPAGGQSVVTAPDADFGTALVVNLSAVVRAISPGDMVLFDHGAGAPLALGVVHSTADVLWAVPFPAVPKTPPPNPPDIAVAHTELELMSQSQDRIALGADTVPANPDPATITARYGFKDVGTIIGVPQAALTSLPQTEAGVPVTYTPASGATAFLQDATGAGLLVTVSGAGQGQVTLTGAAAPPAAITTPLAVPLRLLLDLVPVSRGTTVTGEVLGSGNAALTNQSFTLAKSPLTYLASGAVPASTLTVRVDGVAWQEVPSFFGQAAGARVFVVSRSPDQSVTTVTFGDGVNGARLTSGSGNIVASYRYGSGAASPPAGRLTTISQPQPNLASIQNPVAVSGGADPQRPEDVRADAPASVFTFGRAISAIDYEVVAVQAPGVTRAAAYWTFSVPEQRTLVVVYVGDDEAAVVAATSALAGAEDPNRPVSVLGAARVALGLTCTLIVDPGREVPAVVAAATAAVSGSGAGLFSPSLMGIGQRLYRSAVDAALMVPGVLAVHNLQVLDNTTGGQVLGGEFSDPGEGRFFDLLTDNITIAGVSAGV